MEDTASNSDLLQLWKKDTWHTTVEVRETTGPIPVSRECPPAPVSAHTIHSVPAIKNNTARAAYITGTIDNQEVQCCWTQVLPVVWLAKSTLMLVKHYHLARLFNLLMLMGGTSHLWAH